jgi:hypothetical protein
LPITFSVDDRKAELSDPQGVWRERGVLAMRVKLTLLAFAYLIVSGLLLATAYRSTGPITTPKTDRAAAFQMERFAG